MDANEQQDGRRRGRSYDEAFKRDAVRLVSEEKYTFKAAAAAANVSEQSLRAWHAKFVPARAILPSPA
jgi:transposase-like protein